MVNLLVVAVSLHDIGKAMDHDIDGTHPQIGMDFCRKLGEEVRSCSERNRWSPW